MKILFLPKYNYSGTSSRYRTHQFIPHFERAGIECTVIPFFDDRHINEINQNKRKTAFRHIWLIIKRCKILFIARKFDFLFIEKELTPYFPGIIELLLTTLNVKFILDYDDAVYHNYDNPSKNFLIRFLLRKKIPAIMKKASLVVAGSTYIQDFASIYAENVVKIPTVLDIKKYPPSIPVKSEDFVIGWIGSFYTSKYVLSIMDALCEFSAKHPCKIHLIGFNENLLREHPELPVKVIPWDEKSEAESIQSFTVGIAPLFDTLFTRGKCAFKSIQYMACSLPVITTPIGANGEVTEHGTGGFHANTHEEWIEHLTFLYKNPDIVKKIGTANREQVEKFYTLQSRLPEYLDIFDKLHEK